MVEQRDSELLAHEMESYLRAIREGDVRLTTHGIEVLIAGARTLEQTIAAFRDKREAPAIGDVLIGLRDLVGHTAADPGPADGRLASAADTPEWECLSPPSPELNARGINEDHLRERLRALGESVSAAPRVSELGVASRFVFSGWFDPAILSSWQSDG